MKRLSPTHYLDMQGVYKDSSEELKEATKDVECANSITKHMSPRRISLTQFKNEVQKRAWRMKNRAKHNQYGKMIMIFLFHIAKHILKQI